MSRFAISPDNQLLAASFGSKIIFYDLKTSQESGQSYGLRVKRWISLLTGRMLAVGGEDGVVYIYGIPLNE